MKHTPVLEKKMDAWEQLLDATNKSLVKKVKKPPVSPSQNGDTKARERDPSVYDENMNMMNDDEDMNYWFYNSHPKENSHPAIPTQQQLEEARMVHLEAGLLDRGSDIEDRKPVVKDDVHSSIKSAGDGPDDDVEDNDQKNGE